MDQMLEMIYRLKVSRDVTSKLGDLLKYCVSSRWNYSNFPKQVTR